MRPYRRSDIADRDRRLAGVEGGELGGPFREACFILDRVPPIDRLGEVTHHGHRGGTGDARPLQVPDRGAPEVVRDPFDETGPLAGPEPGPPAAFGRLPVPMAKPRDDLTTHLPE